MLKWFAIFEVMMFFGILYYIKIYKDKVYVKNMSSGESCEAIPRTPYHHPRLLVGDVDSASETIRVALGQVKSRNPLKAIRLLVHPIFHFSGGVSEAEKRIIRMAAYDALAGEVVLHFGDELNDEGVELVFKRRERIDG